MPDIKKISSEGKMPLTETEVAKISGGVTWEELLEGSRNFLPEGNVTCTFCGKSFNAKDNAAGFISDTNESGMSNTRAVARCPYCFLFWCN